MQSSGIKGEGCVFSIYVPIHSYASDSSPLNSFTLSTESTKHDERDSMISLVNTPLPSHGSSKGFCDSGLELGYAIDVELSVPNADTAITTRVLVVDDSVLNRKLLGHYLSQHFTEVLYACNGQEAVNTVIDTMHAETTLDIIFMDSVMPVMDGLEATQKIRQMHVHTPIIAVTGNSLREQVDEFLHYGADVVVTKPVKFDNLQKIISGKHEFEVAFTLLFPFRYMHCNAL